MVSIVPRAHETTGVAAYAFHLLIRSTGDDDWTALTAKSFSKADILNLASAFVGLTVQQAKRLWNSRKLGPEGLRIDDAD